MSLRKQQKKQSPLVEKHNNITLTYVHFVVICLMQFVNAMEKK